MKKETCILNLLMMIVMSCLQTYGQNQMTELNWQIGYHKTENSDPEKWMPASIPGAVQLDVMKAENYKQPFWFGNNVQQFDWMESYYFTCRSCFKKPQLSSNQRLFFHSKGIDYSFKIIINGILVKEQEGMFTYVDLDLTDYLKEENEIKIVLMPVPTTGVTYRKRTETYRQNARESAKPAVSYGWDWHPRLVTRGIWDETCLIVRTPGRITNLDLTYTLNKELTAANIRVNIEGTQLPGNGFEWILKDPNGKIVLKKQGKFSSGKYTIEDVLSNPALWWPNGYGTANLYTSECYLMDSGNNILEQDVRKAGFRKISLIMNEGAWAGSGFPTTRAVAPACLEINNQRIFAKGTNWVHPEIFIGLITPDLYREQILLAKQANFNLLRVWGGGIVNKESFFEICDENGILVWQEFPLACNNYSNDEKYLKVLEQEAHSIVKRVKKHACLAIWSGGNELFNSWSGMTEQSLALRLLNAVCFQLDPKTPFIYTSPLYGMGHGHYLFYDKNTGKDVFQWMSKARNTAYTEFGIPGTANLNVLKQFLPPDELFPPKENTAWETHHGFYAWQKDSWLELPTLEKYFGKMNSLDELVRYSQLLQCEGLKFIYEEARRQKPYCSMALNWCFQEPWPSAANNSLINWPNEIKPAYYHVANACRPVLASVRISKFEWHENEEFYCDPFILNDTYNKLDKGRVTVVLQYDNGKELSLLTWHFQGSAGFQNVKGPTAKIRLPQMANGLFALKIKVDGRNELNSSYVLLYKDKDTQMVTPSDEYFKGDTDFKL